MQVTLSQAQEIAQVAIEAKIQASDKLRHFTFDRAILVREYPPCWTFAAFSEEMAEADYAPSGVFVYIDKSDGHVWTKEQHHDYFYAYEKKAQRQPIAA